MAVIPPGKVAGRARAQTLGLPLGESGEVLGPGVGTGCTPRLLFAQQQDDLGAAFQTWMDTNGALKVEVPPGPLPARDPLLGETEGMARVWSTASMWPAPSVPQLICSLSWSWRLGGVDAGPPLPLRFQTLGQPPSHPWPPVSLPVKWGEPHHLPSTRTRGCRGLDLGPGRDLKEPVTTFSPRDRVTAIQTGWCWTREGRSLKPYTTSATSSRALRRPWAPKRTLPGSAETSWTVSRRWWTVRGPVGSEDKASAPRGGAGRAGEFQEGLGEMGHWSLGSLGPRFCPWGDRHLGWSFIRSTNSHWAPQGRPCASRVWGNACTLSEPTVLQAGDNYCSASR